MKPRKRPTYDLDEVKRLVASGEYRMTKRVHAYLRNHGYDPRETAEDAIGAIAQADFYKGDELDAIPGVYADIYRHVDCYEVEWYVKLFVDANGTARVVRIWSLNEEGALH